MGETRDSELNVNLLRLGLMSTKLILNTSEARTLEFKTCAI